MASPEERLLALAVARGMLEPQEAREQTLPDLMREGRLKPEDRRLLEEDLASGGGEAWSRDLTDPHLALPEGGEAPTAAMPAHPGGSSGLAPASDILAGIRSARAEGLFRVKERARWGRFESLVFIGEGGMGRIFRATDPRLRRSVALKLLRRDDPDLLHRFLQEAQLQARVDHPNVCRVYEVGEWRGQPYIAMQYLQGKTLRDAAPDLPLDTLLALMVQVCEGVHAAHRVGLVHRDLKPGNLMVEWPEEGGPRASVLDFGLARGLEGGGVTQTGHIMGTVAYMSPEQARGDATQLDRRSDVYSLGATLYMLLTGRPPFEGEGLECMARVVKDEPVPLRRRVPGLPADLETVVQVCLEKDPRRRYPTARALGEDLQRILDHEPIEARAAGLPERAIRWARRHKAVVAASISVLFAALLFGGLTVRERIRAQAQTSYARQFAQEAERIEALARYIRLQPAHDLTRDEAGLRKRVADLEREVSLGGALAQAPGAYALGRARLALDDPSAAVNQLQRAWGLGYQAPEVAHALGRAEAAVYQVEVGKAYGIPDPDQRARRIAQLNRTLRDPAAAWLARGASASLEPAAYRAGWLALMQGDPRRAAGLAQTAQAQAPWFYEAMRLQAEARISQARESSDPRLADSLLAEAGALLAQAEGRAPCDVDLLRLEMRQRQEAIALNWQVGADPKPLVEAQVDVANRWARLEPGAAQPLAWRARARAEEARYLAIRGQDPSPWLNLARKDTDAALQRDSQDVDALTAEASVLRTEGIQRMNQEEDPNAPLKEAIRVADQGIRLDPSQIVLLNIQNSALLTWISVTGMQGTFERAAALPYLRAAEREARAHPDEAYFQANVGSLALAMARAELNLGQDPQADAQEAVRAYVAALKFQPSHVAFHRGVLVADAIRARALVKAGTDPGLVLKEAQQAYDRARTLGVPLETLSPYLLEALTASLEWARIQHLEPRALLEAGRGLEAGLAYDAEDSEEVLGIGLRFVIAWLRLNLPDQQERARERGRALAQRMSRQRSLDPTLWSSLATLESLCGHERAARAAKARAARVLARGRS